MRFATKIHLPQLLLAALLAIGSVALFLHAHKLDACPSGLSADPACGFPDHGDQLLRAAAEFERGVALALALGSLVALGGYLLARRGMARGSHAFTGSIESMGSDPSDSRPPTATVDRLDEERNQLVNLLRSECDFSQSLTESLPGVFYVISTDARFVRWNRNFEIVTGRSAAEMACISPVDLFSGEDKDLIAQRIGSVFTDGQASAEASLVVRDGDPCPYFFTGRRVVANGQTLLVGLGIDVSAMKGLERELAQHRDHLEQLVAMRTRQIADAHRGLEAQEHFIRAITDNISGMVGYWDAELRCRFANPAYFNWFGRQPEEIMGIHVTALLGEELFRQNEPFIRGVLRGEPQQFEQTRARADGSVGHVLAHYIPDVVDGQVRGFYVTAADITKLKQAEAATLAALKEARRLARVKSDFLANMSHEIRTPLNAILGLAQVGVRDPAGHKSQVNFRRILDSGQHLLSVVNDILDFSKIEAGKLGIEQTPFRLGEMIDRAIALIAVPAYAKGLDFHLNEAADLPETVTGDAMRLAQVLVNLLSNAVKFTEHGQVALDIRKAGGALVFCVTDSGIGMTTEQMARLFHPFEQADNSTTRRFGGTGLGLAISARLMEMMGGTLRGESHPGQGTRFELRWPAPGIEAAPPLRFPHCDGGIGLIGLPADEANRLAADLRARGLRAEIATALQGGGENRLRHLVVSLEAIHDGCFKAPDGARVIVLVTPGKPASLAGVANDAAVVIERPARVRHLCQEFGQRPAETLNVSPRLAGLRVLAAEDVALNREVLADILDPEGVKLVFAENGRQALDLLQAHGAAAFDVVLMDVQMPEMDGIEATRRIHALAPRLPVIGLTAHAIAEERRRCLEAGMAAHITKPIDIDALVAAILEQVPARPSAAIAPPESMPPAVAVAAGGIIDWDALARQYRGRQAFIGKLLDIARQHHGQAPAQLREAVRQGNLESMAFIAHALKGVGANLKVPALLMLAQEAESSARKGRSDAAALAERLAAKTEELLAALQARASASTTDTQAEIQ